MENVIKSLSDFRICYICCLISTLCLLQVISHSDILTETQNEGALEQIQFLEDAARHRRTVGEEEIVMTPPQFSRPLHNIETIEGTNIHLECRLQPVGDSSMRVDWFVNGRPVKIGQLNYFFSKLAAEICCFEM